MAAHYCFRLIVLSVLVAVSSEYDLRGKPPTGEPTPEECMRPPMSKHGHECCRLPKERIWGDLRKSLKLCLKKMKEEPLPSRQEMADGDRETVTPGGPETVPPTDTPSELGTSPSTIASTTIKHNRQESSGRQKPLSERLKAFFTSVYKDIKKTFSSIWQSVVMITDHVHRHENDSCFMECVFEDQGFLLNKMLNKDAMISRLGETLRTNEPWHKAAVAAVEVCYRDVMSDSKNANCTSGSEKVFRCVFKQLFFNCPSWTQTDYCKSLKEFYEKCPNGPPPEIDDAHPTEAIPQEEIESSPSTETYTGSV